MITEKYYIIPFKKLFSEFECSDDLEELKKKAMKQAHTEGAQSIVKLVCETETVWIEY